MRSSLSGSLHFCHWVAQSTSRTPTLCPVGFREGMFMVLGSSYLGLEHTDNAPKRLYTANQVCDCLVICFNVSDYVECGTTVFEKRRNEKKIFHPKCWCWRLGLEISLPPF